MKIPFGDLQRHYTKYKKEYDRALLRVGQSGWYVLGKEVQAFERAFAKFCGAKYCIGVASGLDAIMLSLRAAGIRKGDEVITSPLSAMATVLAIAHIDAIPVYADIDPVSYTIDPNDVERKISKKTKAIIPVHIYGQSADMQTLTRIAKKHRISIIEDAAQAHGATFHGRCVGTFGDAGAFSFYPSKNLGAFGDAGAVITNSKQIAESIRQLRDYGQKSRYEHVVIGYNSRLDEVQAAILNVKLRHLTSWNKRRSDIARLYSKQLHGLPLVLPHTVPGRGHIWHIYAVCTPHRARLQRYLAQYGIMTQIHYPRPLYEQKASSSWQRGAKTCPVSQRIIPELVSLPLFPELTDKEVMYIIRTIKKFFSQF